MQRIFIGVLFALSASFADAAVVVRYFSDTSSGSGDATTWADRGALISSGALNSIITSFAFNGSDALEVRFEGGKTYTITAAIAAGLWSNPPTPANPIVFHGCDSSGNRLAPPDPDWVSAQPAWSDTSLPIIATSGNIASVTLANSIWRMAKFTASGRSAAMIGTGTAYSIVLDWCWVENSTSNSGAAGLSTVQAYNCVVRMTGTSYDYAAQASPQAVLFNSRLVGNTSASSGNRRGLVCSASTSNPVASRLTILDHPGAGVISVSTNTGSFTRLLQSVIAGCGTGISGSATASQTETIVVHGSVITGSAGWGVSASAGNVIASGSRLRDNASGNITGTANYGDGFGNETGPGSDAAEYVDAAGGDFRIKAGSSVWGRGFGVADEPAASGGGGTRVY